MFKAEVSRHYKVNFIYLILLFYIRRILGILSAVLVWLFARASNSEQFANVLVFESFICHP